MTLRKLNTVVSAVMTTMIHNKTPLTYAAVTALMKNYPLSKEEKRAVYLALYWYKQGQLATCKYLEHRFKILDKKHHN